VRFRTRPACLCVVALASLFLVYPAVAAPFVLFPKAGQLVSPDGQWLVRNVEAETASTDFNGTFRSLWLSELRTGRSRKLCDYLGVAAVAWSGNDTLIVTQYVGKRSSRVAVFSVTDPDNTIVLDVPTLSRLVSAEQRARLRENDHIFIEGSRAEPQTLYLRVWGYGKQAANDFRWRCQYSFRDGNIACADGGASN